MSPPGHLPSTASTTRGAISSSRRDASIRRRRSGRRTRLMRKIWGGRGDTNKGLRFTKERGTRGSAEACGGLCQRGTDMGTWGGPLGTYFIKAHFCEWLGEEGDVPGALHGGAIHCGERGHPFGPAQTSLTRNQVLVTAWGWGHPQDPTTHGCSPTDAHP